MKKLTLILIGLFLFSSVKAEEKDNYSSLVKIVEESRWTYEINSLSKCESNNRWHIKVLDVNGKMSRGGLQFQDSTWLNAIEKYEIFPNIPKKNWLDFVYSEIYQKVVAITILNNEKNGLLHWKNCATSQGLINKDLTLK